MPQTDLDMLLDGTLDDLADIPEFKAWPNGAHRANIKWDIKEIGNQHCPVLDMIAIETMELTDAVNDQPLVAGTTTNIAFMFKTKEGKPNEIGQGQFKEVMKSLAAHFGEKSNRELMEESNGCEVLVVTKVRKDKNNPDKTYTSLENLQVV